MIAIAVPTNRKGDFCIVAGFPGGENGVGAGLGVIAPEGWGIVGGAGGEIGGVTGGTTGDEGGSCGSGILGGVIGFGMGGGGVIVPVV